MLQSEIHFASNDVIIDRISTPSLDQVCENETWTINHISSPRQRETEVEIVVLGKETEE
jgi:hypothetical protein